MKKNIAIVTGGNSSEYDISMQSARFVEKNIDPALFNTYFVTLKGREWLLNREPLEPVEINKNDFSCTINNSKLSFDCALIMIHGNPGEDGKLQGYFDMIGMPYTTSGVLSLSLSFDKYKCNNYLKYFGVTAAKSVLLKSADANFDELVEQTGLPCFVKPNQAGSSFGISKVNHKNEFTEALQKAFAESEQVLVEEFINGTEITCGVFKTIKEEYIFPVTEIVSKRDFFDTTAKYTPEFVEEITPARIEKDIAQQCSTVSSKIYDLLDCRGIVRIDYILKNRQLFLLEVNSIPGMTENSLVPKQLTEAKLDVRKIYTLLIQDTLERNINHQVHQ